MPVCEKFSVSNVNSLLPFWLHGKSHMWPEQEAGGKHLGASQYKEDFSKLQVASWWKGQ